MYRRWRLVTLTGWSVSEIDDTPAVVLDELLAVDEVIESARAAQR